MQPMGRGNPDAAVMVVGEVWTEVDQMNGTPLTGRMGEMLNRLLGEAGIYRSTCYVTCVWNGFLVDGEDDLERMIHRKKKDHTNGDVGMRDEYCEPRLIEAVERLYFEIDMVKPTLVIAMGEVAMWALTGAQGVMKWRGSVLEMRSLDGAVMPTLVVPTLSLSVLQWSPELHAVVVHDLRRARMWSEREGQDLPGAGWKIRTRPSLDDVREVLEYLLARVNAGENLWVDFDLETRAGHIACAGISWSATEALCIPLMCVENFEGYWGEEEEADIVKMLCDLLTHPRVKVRGQNLLYDAQYTMRHWGWSPRVAQDTMISHHTCFSALSKSLAFQASLYCDDYVYWKDDGKTWVKDVSEDQLWRYNGVDCLRTRAVGEATGEMLSKDGTLQRVDEFQQALLFPVLYAMCRGVRINLEAKKGIIKELKSGLGGREKWLTDVLGHPLNIKSPVQMKALLYDDLGCQVVKQRRGPRRGQGVTCDDEALRTIAKREPLVRPLVRVVQEMRSMGVFLSTFAEAKVDEDGRMRCSYNICGTKTYRFSSSQSAFESGLNLQNIPKGGEAGDVILPNIRALFIPDEGKVMFDLDLDRADLQVVVWESGEEELKEALRRGVDMHLLNALTLKGKDVSLDDLIEGTERCETLKREFSKERALAKSFIHGTNYGGGERTMAIAAGITVVEAERFQKMYFGKYPGIKRWHERVARDLDERREVSNILGYRHHFFEDVTKILPEALAWIPQSTVGCVINRVWMNIWNHAPHIEVLMQVHDSLVGQWPIEMHEQCLDEVKQLSRIVLPYDDPLIIPSGVKVSKKSWGEVK